MTDHDQKHDYRQHPIDSESAARLAEQDLRLDVVDTANRATFAHWLRAENRGFHDAELSDETVQLALDGAAYRRTTGVWDPTEPDAEAPVGTVSSWPAELTVPGDRSIPSWAISAVTVSPTHRRRGIARALLEAELRTAAALGVPLAMLTVSESTIYGRFGFAPATMTTDWTFDTRRASWAGAPASGRLHFLPLAQMVEEAPALFEKVRLRTPGEILVWDTLWASMHGLRSDDKDAAKNLRAVRYDDADGIPQGFALYRVRGGEKDFAEHYLDVHYLLSATDDAYAGLWRYLLEVDLVIEVRAFLRPVDEPVIWQLTDLRAARPLTRDHLWLRILDVPTTLQTRSYSAPGRIVLEVSDPLDFAAGRYLLDVAGDGTAQVTTFDGEIPDDAAALSLGVNELSALYLGGIAAGTLSRARRIEELRPGSADAVDAAFRASRAPWLSFWF